MKTISVVAALIFRTTATGERELFACKRGYGEFKGAWEFPGGKIEEGETPQQALVREIREELNTEIKVHEYIDRIEYDYPTFYLSMQLFLCSVVSGKLELLEHENATWLTRETLRSVHWLPADVAILDKVEAML